jgi:hypothetical protein
VTVPPDSLPLTTVRAGFLEAAGNAADLIADRRVAACWEEASALNGMTVGAVAAHLAAAPSRIDGFLDAAEPPGTRALPADRFFRDVPGDLDNAVHRGVRDGSLELAAIGPAALVVQVRAEIDNLAQRFRRESPTRRIRAVFGLDMRLDDYLVTRMVELVVHTDDLAASVGAVPPAFSDDVARPVIECLVGVTRRRHGDLAVIRALARQDRAAPNVLKVF